MTIEEKLMTEIKAAIRAVFADGADQEFEDGCIKTNDIDAIAKKTKFYMDL